MSEFFNREAWLSDALAEIGPGGYEPDDQGVRLPPPPWMPDHPAVIAWEGAHGHDPRLKCIAEFGCQVTGVPSAIRLVYLLMPGGPLDDDI